MSKFYGKIGYAMTVEKARGVWVEETVEKFHHGDILHMSRRSVTSDKVNDDVTISSQISIIADPFACENFGRIRYVVLGGIQWEVNSVDLEYPRLKLNLGGEYHGTKN